MFNTLIVQPIFNLLILIYALIPGHNFGLAIIIFTIVVRLLMWPLVRKQLHHAKAMRELQPELKRIKAAAKGDRQKESQLTMELYKEKEINPFASIGIILIQLPILLGLYISIRKIIQHPHQIIDFSYPFIQHLGWIQTLSHDIHKFDDSLFGLVNLTRTASGPTGIYWPAMVIVVASAIAQYLQSKQLMPVSKDQRSLRQIMSQAGKGAKADQAEVNAAVSRFTVFFIPVIVFLVSLNLAVALPLYWLVSSTMAYFQQARVLEADVTEAEAIADRPTSKAAAKPAKTTKAIKPAPAGRVTETKSGLKVTRRTISATQNQKNARKSKRRKR
jgi:YidC/Oxa1 family membrane protein insertase